jgi:hypothetical protein
MCFPRDSLKAGLSLLSAVTCVVPMLLAGVDDQYAAISAAIAVCVFRPIVNGHSGPT